MMTRRLCLLLGLAGLAACTGHSSEYASRGYPDPTVVGSTRDVYRATENRDRLTNELEDRTVPSAEPPGGEVRGPSASFSTVRPKAAPADLLEAEIRDLRRIEASLSRGTARYDPTTFTPEGVPVPVSSEPRVLRIWVAPWQDVSGDTIVAGYVFAGMNAPQAVLPHHGTRAFAGSSNHLQSVEMIEARARDAAPSARPVPQRGPANPQRPVPQQAGAEILQARSAQPSSGVRTH
ncbi:MAG: TraV family lipoprotein [Pseudomonadota bacterium]